MDAVLFFASGVRIELTEVEIDVYHAAAKQRVLIVGGSARTVGAAGYLLGGGHSPFAHYYGLAADSQWSIGTYMSIQDVLQNCRSSGNEHSLRER